MKEYMRGNRVFYRVGKTTVCFIQPYGDRFMLCYGTPAASNLGVVCGSRAEAGEKARAAVARHMEMLKAI